MPDRSHSLWRRRPVAALAAITQLCLLAMLLWLASDKGAHHRLHHLVDAVCKMCGHHADGCVPDSKDVPESNDEDCGITLFARGHATVATLPASVEVPVPSVLFLNGTLVLPVLPPSPQLLPYSCGPPSLVA
ncbi:MAG: hypothetical protein L0Z50_28000 [Verrucomicrobiales bacterium]|nr:hypothetical protein [Verrucomicrobiales bacterium]